MVKEGGEVPFERVSNRLQGQLHDPGRTIMKFGEYLDAQATPAWRDHYVRYKYLKGILKSIVSRNEEARTNAGSDSTRRWVERLQKSRASLPDVPGGATRLQARETAEGRPRSSRCSKRMLRKCARSSRILSRRSRRAAQLDVDVHQAHREGLLIASSRAAVADKFLDSTSSPRTAMITSAWTSRPIPRSTVALSRRLRISATHSTLCKTTFCIEKFANLNTTAVYKILKKHDKLIPATTCCRYYLERLHNQPWIREDHSAVFVVQISDLFALLRGR